jgi:hypothetical protein
MPKKEIRPLAVVVVEKVGWRNGLSALTYLASWGVASDSLGHPATVKEVSEYWNQSLSITYRERVAFASVWPELVDTPEVLWDKVKAQVRNRRKKSVATAEVLAVRLA